MQICALTREPMDDHNPPLVFPNGYVFSTMAVDLLTVEDDGGKLQVVCPMSGKTYDRKEIKRVFVM